MYYIGNSCIKVLIEDYQSSKKVDPESMISNNNHNNSTSYIHHYTPVYKKEVGVNYGFFQETALANSDSLESKSFYKSNTAEMQENTISPPINHSKQNIFSYAKRIISSKMKKAAGIHSTTSKEDLNRMHTFIYCVNCGQIVTEVAKVPDRMNNMSSLMYLYCL